MEGKLSYYENNYWLQAEVKGAMVSIVIFIFEKEQVKLKLSSLVDLHTDLKELLVVGRPQEIIKMLSKPANYKIRVKDKTLELRWAVTAEDYEFKVSSKIRLNIQKLNEMEALACQNYFLKNQLHKLQQAMLQQSNPSQRPTTIEISDQISMQPELSEENGNRIAFMANNSNHKKAEHPSIDNEDASEEQKKMDEKLKKSKPISKNRSQKPRQRGQSNEIETQKAGYAEDKKNKRRREKSQSQAHIKKEQPHSQYQKKSTEIRIDLGNGDYYLGELKNGKFHGHGILQSQAHGRHEGSWVNGVAHGEGIHFDTLGNKYTGSYENDKRNGRGVEDYINGERYEGQFKNDVKSGRGKYFYSDGDVYDGEWSQDVYEGKGKETYANKSSYEGSFHKDEKHGEGIYTDSFGCQYKQVWIEGKLQKQSPLSLSPQQVQPHQ